MKLKNYYAERRKVFKNLNLLVTKIGINLSKKDYTYFKGCIEALKILPNNDILLDFKQKALEEKEVDDIIW